MKVYELMEALSEAPAGNEICVAEYFNDKEIIDHTTEVSTDDDYGVLKRLEFGIEIAESGKDFFQY